MFPNLIYLRESEFLVAVLPLMIDRPMSIQVHTLLKSILADQPKKRPSAEDVLKSLAELDSDTTRRPDSQSPQSSIGAMY